jgi:hypothetical protein
LLACFGLSLPLASFDKQHCFCHIGTSFIDYTNATELEELIAKIEGALHELHLDNRGDDKSKGEKDAV